MSIPYYSTYRFFSFWIFFAVSLSGLTQTDPAVQKLVDTTNFYYRASDLLNLGEVYRPEHIYAQGHPYFITDEYTIASLSVGNTAFEKLKARYNIATDQLIIKAKVDSGLLVNMVTKEDWINSFKINGHFFVNSGKLYPDKNVKGYVEEVYKGKRTFYIKYRKKFIDTYNDATPEGFFSIVKTNKYVYENGIFIPVDKKSAFLKLYSDKKSIKKFMRENKIRYSKASTVQLNLLMQFCDGLPKSI